MMIEQLTKGDEMTHTVRISEAITGSLTTERAESSRNIPVLVIDGMAYGPADIVAGMPNDDIFGETYAADLVRTWGNCTRTQEERSAAQRFLSQWPAGPQLTGVIYA